MKKNMPETTPIAQNLPENKALLVEVAWEICNQLGGIYTVIRSKAPCMTDNWGKRYCGVGTYLHANVTAEFEPDYDLASDIFGRAVASMRRMGFEVHFGHWLITGQPRVVLFNPYSVYDRLGSLKYELWEHHGIESPANDELFGQVVAFGFLTKVFLVELEKLALEEDRKVIAHFHEWMAALPIPALGRLGSSIKTIFTTHATLLGRYIAMNHPQFYDMLPFLDWEDEARHYNVEAIARTERAAAHGANIFTTVSEVTARECVHLLGRRPDFILPNGLNIERFTALHEFQVLHQKFKDKINQFVMGHFFQSYSFNLDTTLYFFTSGRFEYRNKGYDMALEALRLLNQMMKEANIETTVIMFFITKQPVHSVNPHVLNSRAIMEEIRETCQAIENQVGQRLFQAAAAQTDNTLPNLNNFVDDYWKLRLRRTVQSWRTQNLPSVVTHNLVNDQSDEILNFLRRTNLVNNQNDRVKIVYHPDFITPTNPLFGLEYGQFVRGCHLGVFPSYYEPWGYTPLECIATGVPTVTSDLAGFGDYVLQTMPDHDQNGIYIVRRKHKPYYEATQQLANILFEFVKQSRKDRIAQRNKTERSSDAFDWQYLTKYYEQAYKRALEL